MPEYLLYITWRCNVCGNEAERGANKPPFAPDHYEGSSHIERGLICRGTCRRLPTSALEESAVADHAKSIPVNGYLGPTDGLVPQTTTHTLLHTRKNHAEAKRQSQLRKNR